MKKKTKKRQKKHQKKFGQSLPYNELNMNFNRNLLKYSEKKHIKHIKHTCNKNLDL